MVRVDLGAHLREVSCVVQYLGLLGGVCEGVY